MYSEYEIRAIPLSVKSMRKKVEIFLNNNGLRLDDTDYYAGIFRLEEDDILACGGLTGNLIKCIAVSDEMHGNGLSNRLISHLISVANANNHRTIRVFTKPSNKDIFTSLGFNVLACSDKAILLENNSSDLNNYLNYLQNNRKDGINGCIVMNCNPFTLGHRYLIEQASKTVDNLYIIPVKEDVSTFTYSERKEMIESGVKDIKNVIVLEGSDYAVSQTTFPTYFIKNLNDTTDTHITLDLDIFVKYIAPALNAKYRFAGSEPTDLLTRRYNELLERLLEPNGINVRVIPRLEQSDGVISASRVRQHLKEKSLRKASESVPYSTLPYLLSLLCVNSLQEELDTTPKPGLVDKSDSGSHKDMDYNLMQQSIKTLRPYFTKLAVSGYNKNLLSVAEIKKIGMDAEKAMFQTTNGVNTHKGALFSLGLTTICAAHLMYIYNEISEENLQSCISMLADRWPQPENTHGDKVLQQNKIKGALYNAVEGYKELFEIWMPYYTQNKDDEYCLHKLLLLIMSSLDDTNVYYRKDSLTVEKVKWQAKELFENFDIDNLRQLNTEYIKENISSGGAADMLSLTLLIYSFVH
ncbi:MAG: [Bacteroidales bacterium]|nr:[citrate (pro-3S)-lyase] ligase [Bacteroidales bacterium]